MSTPLKSERFLKESYSANRPIRLPFLKRVKFDENMQKLNHHESRIWMKKTGKNRFIDFDSAQRTKLKKMFNELDKDCSGALDINELYEPLLALGLVDSRSQIAEYFKKVDFNNSGVIEFEEFLKILKNAKNRTGENLLIDFFKDLTNGKIFNQFETLPFQLLFSGRRREIMLQSYIGKNKIMKEKGNKVLKAFASELNESKERISSGKVKSEKNLIYRKLCEFRGVSSQNRFEREKINILEKFRFNSTGKRLRKIKEIIRE